MTDPQILRRTGFQAAIVDLDGTMVDTVGDFEVALGGALADLGCKPVDQAFIRLTVGKGSEHLIKRTLEQVGAPASLYDQAWERYQHHYLAINGQHSAVYAGVIEGLKALRERGFKLACLTNKPTAFAMPLLEACKALGTAPERTLMIGDSSNDAKAARAAGCPVVLVSYGYNHGEPVAAAAPDAIVDRIDAVPALLAPR